MNDNLQTAGPIRTSRILMLRPLLSGATCVLLVLHALTALAQPPPRPDMVRVFLDCNRCDEDYLRKEVTFVDYVRNREDADVHVLVTTQPTGGGGSQWTLKFIGLGRYQGQDQTLTYNSTPNATGDEIRAGFAELFRLGLVRYAAESSIGDRLRVTFKKQEGPAAADKKKDPWNYWVFRIGGGGNLSGEQSSQSRSFRSSFSANRTTEAWRITFNASGNYRDNKFVFDDEEGVRQTVLSVSRNLDAGSSVVKSLNQHWSIGATATVNSQTFRNFVLRTNLDAGIEYDVYPYSESTRRMLTFQYTLGHGYNRYREITIFEKLSEQLVRQRGEVGLSLRQPWGSVSARMNYQQFLDMPSKYSLGAFGGANVRIFKGFSVNVFGEFSRTRDQIYLPLGAATTEEVLLRQRQLATGYEYFMNFNLSYSFGSIFNNIVNPRFGNVDVDF